MDDSNPTFVPDEPVGAESAERYGPDSGQVWEFVRAQQHELAGIEARLEAEFARLTAALEEQSHEAAEESSAAAAELKERLALLDALEARLLEQRESLRQAMDQGQRHQQALLEQIEQGNRQLDERHAELRQDRTRVRDGQREIARLRERYQADLKHLAEDRERCSRRSRELDAEYDDLAEMRSRTAAQRQRIADELHERRAEFQTEMQRRAAELEAAFAARQRDHEESLVAVIRQKDDCEQRLRAVERDRDRLAGQLESALAESQQLREQIAGQDSQGPTGHELREQRDAALHQAALAAAEQAALRAECEQLRADQAAQSQAREQLAGELRRQEEQTVMLELELEAARGPGQPASAEQMAQIERLAAENAQLAEQTEAAEAQTASLLAELNETSRELAGMQRQLAEMESSDGHGDAGDARRRLELALDELKTERERSADLQRRLSRAGNAAPASSGGEASDWESQKRRLLAALEADDAGAGQPMSVADRLQIEQALRSTERVVQEKDREIEELQELLQQQSTQFGTMAVGAAAVVEVLDKDEIIRQERENLQHLQDEWREKLRKAEVDISVERAKLARERADLEEKLRTYEAQQAQQAKESAANPKEKPAKPDRSRWLTRLGLKETDE
ncbi:MAG: hypothetical protein AB7O62_04725 [Pirellulales bacterium]